MNVEEKSGNLLFRKKSVCKLALFFSTSPPGISDERYQYSVLHVVARL